MGDSATVQCSITSGDLPVLFSWMLNGVPVKEEDGITLSNIGKKTSVLSIDSLSEIHAGNYTCLASNKAGIVSYTTELVVKGTNFLIVTRMPIPKPDTTSIFQLPPNCPPSIWVMKLLTSETRCPSFATL